MTGWAEHAGDKVLSWIDAGKKDGEAVEILYLARWAYATGRAAAWCPFDGAAEAVAVRRFYQQHAMAAEAAEMRRHDALHPSPRRHGATQAADEAGLGPGPTGGGRIGWGYEGDLLGAADFEEDET